MTGRLLWIFAAFIAYTYAGYPLLLAFLARLKPERHFIAGRTPAVTLLIAAHDEEAVIAAKIENSLALDYPPAELHILVAADGSGDNTAGIVRRYQDRGVELSYHPRRQGKARAINRALTRAKGDIVVLSDANNLYQPEALRILVKPFSDGRVGAATGAKVILPNDGELGQSEGLYWRYESFLKEQETRLGCCTAATGEILAIRRTLLEPLPEDTINDDFYLIARVMHKGYDVVYVPKARSLERISISAVDERARRARIIAGRYQAISWGPKLLPLNRPLVTWQILSHKYFRPLVPLAMIGAFLTSLAAVIGSPKSQTALSRPKIPINGVLFGLQLAFYGLAFTARWVKAPGLLGRLLYLPAFLLDSNWAALVGLSRFIRGSQSNRWQRVGRRIHASWSLFEDKGENYG